MGEEASRLNDEIRRDPAEISDDPEVIEQEIEQTRAELSGTIDAIQERLNPEALKAQVKEAAHDATIGRVVDAKDQAVERVQDIASQASDKVRQFAGIDSNRSQPLGADDRFNRTSQGNTAILETIRANPIPAVIAGAGIGMALARKSNDGEGRSSTMRNAPENQYRYGRQQMNYRTGYTNWDRSQPKPSHLREYESDSFTNQLSSTGGDLLSVIQRNPIPAALAGVGIGWYLMRRSNSNDHGDQPYYYRPGDKRVDYARYDEQSTFANTVGNQNRQRNWQENDSSRQYDGSSNYEGQSGVGDRVGEYSSNVQDAASDAMHRAQDIGSDAIDHASQFGAAARDQVSHFPDHAQDQFQHLRGAYQKQAQESPLVLGVVAMGVGLAVGMLIPETQRENEVFGDKRDELFDRTQEMAGQVVERVQEVGHDAVQAAQETIQEATSESEAGSSSAANS